MQADDIIVIVVVIVIILLQMKNLRLRKPNDSQKVTSWSAAELLDWKLSEGRGCVSVTLYPSMLRDRWHRAGSQKIIEHV